MIVENFWIWISQDYLSYLSKRISDWDINIKLFIFLGKSFIVSNANTLVPNFSDTFGLFYYSIFLFYFICFYISIYTWSFSLGNLRFLMNLIFLLPLFIIEINQGSKIILKMDLFLGINSFFLLYISSLKLQHDITIDYLCWMYIYEFLIKKYE